MKKILIAGSKGGNSKTTLALCLAACLAQSYKVCLIDTDPQGSLNSFKELLKIDVREPAELKKSNYDVAVIDTAPYLSTKLPGLLEQADYVALPCRPNVFDAVAIKAIIALLPAGKPAGIVLTQVQHRVNISDVLSVLQGYNVPILKQAMSYRVAYARAALQNVFETDDIKAQKEMLSLVLDIFAQL